MPRKLFLLMISVLVLLALGASLWQIRASINKKDNIENIVFLTIDTLRADHLSSYGYPRQTTPFLDSIAQRGLRFEHARSSISHTAPSHASMFTSLYPFQHNLLRNQERLPKGIYTIVDMVKEQGFETAAFPAVRFLEGKVGFEVVKSSVPLPESLSKQFWYRNAKNIVDRVETWLDQRKEHKKLLLWVHMYDAHMWEGNGNIPKEYLEKYSLKDNSLKDNAHAEYIIKNHNIPLSYHDNNVEKLLKAINGYDARISYIDDQVKRLYNFLEVKGINKNSLWIITSDHGEGLGNHHYHGHGQFIYEEQLRVPFILHFRPERAPGKVVQELVRSVDILPTVADLLGKSLPMEELGMQGKSFAGLVLGGSFSFGNEFAFAQRRPKAMDRLRKDWKEGDVYALQDKNLKYIEHTVGDDEFYDLGVDKFEMENLSGKGDEREKKLRETIGKLMESAKKFEPHTKNKQMKKKEVEELKALGYM